MKPDIKDLRFTEFEAYLRSVAQPLYRARQVWQWLFQKQATSFGAMSNLAASLRVRLDADFSIGRLTVVKRAESADGTVKFLFGLNDGQSVESVLIPEPKRLTLCISTQVGCAYGCAFCATARLGFKRNLRTGEIVEQIVEASRGLAPQAQITNVVLMGMGEPLANYEHTVEALKIITDNSWGLGIAPRRVTLSTVGLIPQIEKLMAETNVSLAISLHAASDQLRGRLMPVNRKYSLEQLMECCRNLPLAPRKRITFEYVLLRDVNDSLADARALCRVLRGVPSKVNVIPFNPHEQSEFQRPTEASIKQFQQVLFDHRIQVNVRRPRGDDIAAACGQLQGQAQALRQASLQAISLN